MLSHAKFRAATVRERLLRRSRTSLYYARFNKALLAEAGQLKTECAQVCATITDQSLRDQIEHDYDDRIRKKYQQITKL